LQTHRFWLVRHALVDAASLAYLYGTNDVPLCETALETQSGTFAGLAARLPRPARLICTPLSRTQLTLQAITAAGYPGHAPALDAAFVEQDFGAFQGQPIASFDGRPAGERHPFWPIDAAETPPGGENFDMMIARVGARLEALAAATDGFDHTVIVTHGGAIRAACAHALALSAHQALCLSVENLSLTRLEHDERGWRLASLNEHISTPACETSPAFTDAGHSRNRRQDQRP
jgi:broad specificity phosphatase PhoE